MTTCVSTIAEHFEFSLPTISKHLKELREAKIITMEKKGNKIYIEPNIEIVRELGGCFTTLTENFEKNRELFFGDVVFS
ncbi:helix-turn-helix transcriptional regulator [Sulfurimonas sp.]|jgi:ArsR family transcriptional regulator, arsenate/arsenite/antimonite-responsive transcriptional repressor|uniref:ArsR/SmtB family transcription factor n=1 Tax=Sulfurimonas sp. TaxID=2022749 RepID=UPI0025F73EEF|nr:metalloregulator ArsR/SmtB family transcription factor [Sulfurimonas sp.]MBT5935786.1 helix-turn-helix transcriptional regulator [Sulfurimonas sp.]